MFGENRSNTPVSQLLNFATEKVCGCAAEHKNLCKWHKFRVKSFMSEEKNLFVLEILLEIGLTIIKMMTPTLHCVLIQACYKFMNLWLNTYECSECSTRRRRSRGKERLDSARLRVENDCLRRRETEKIRKGPRNHASLMMRHLNSTILKKMLPCIHVNPLE